MASSRLALVAGVALLAVIATVSVLNSFHVTSGSRLMRGVGADANEKMLRLDATRFVAAMGSIVAAMAKNTAAVERLVGVLGVGAGHGAGSNNAVAAAVAVAVVPPATPVEEESEGTGRATLVAAAGAQTVCKSMQGIHHMCPGHSWGTLPSNLQKVWSARQCDNDFLKPDKLEWSQALDVSAQQAVRDYVTALPHTPLSASLDSVDEALMRAVHPSEQGFRAFMEHYFATECRTLQACRSVRALPAYMKMHAHHQTLAVVARLLRIFQLWCGAVGVKFVPLGGTLIGIVRHGGFIPWEHDGDVMVDAGDLAKLARHMDLLPADVTMNHHLVDGWSTDCSGQPYGFDKETGNLTESEDVDDTSFCVNQPIPPGAETVDVETATMGEKPRVTSHATKAGRGDGCLQAYFRDLNSCRYNIPNAEYTNGLEIDVYILPRRCKPAPTGMLDLGNFGRHQLEHATTASPFSFFGLPFPVPPQTYAWAGLSNIGRATIRVAPNTMFAPDTRSPPTWIQPVMTVSKTLAENGLAEMYGWSHHCAITTNAACDNVNLGTMKYWQNLTSVPGAGLVRAAEAVRIAKGAVDASLYQFAGKPAGHKIYSWDCSCYIANTTERGL